jgi:branched-chain amino acid transport system substrate-binding protein
VLHIATISNSEDITKLDPSPYTYSVVPNTYMLSKAVAVGVSRLAREKGWTRYATIASDYAWGRSSQEIQVDLLRDIAPEIQLIDTHWPRLGQTRFNSFIVSIIAQKPDFVLGSIAGADNALWMRDARDYRLFNKVAYPGGLVSVTELINNATGIRRGLYGRTRAPFYAHMDVALMQHLVKTYREKFGRYPSDWTVMAYDSVLALKQGVESSGSIKPDQLKDALKGAKISTTRGELYFRKIDNQLSCSTYFGRVGDDPSYPFPILVDLLELKAPGNWRPESEILAARNQ